MSYSGNQGLEALASLCGGAIKVQPQTDISPLTQDQNSDESSSMPPPIGHITHSNNVADTISNKSPITHHQLYQAVLSAANSPNNINQFPFSNINHVQRPIQHLDNNCIDNVAYYNHHGYNAQHALQLNASNQHAQAPIGYVNIPDNVENYVAATLGIAASSSVSIDQLRFQGGGNGCINIPAFVTETQTEKLNSKDVPTCQTHELPAKSHAALRDNFDASKRKDAKESTSLSKRTTTNDKKQEKRAANRKSAQLSRKRKKQFIEELKEENDELRHKEQILRSIPDLVVVFDSAGKLAFVSQSVSRFLEYTSGNLEGTSFWDRLCSESVKLLKAAFMDALAAKKPGMETIPLGDGLWELKMIDKDGKQKMIFLNGVVYTAGESPECVCSIRPADDKSTRKIQQYAAESDNIYTQHCTNKTRSTNAIATISGKIGETGLQKRKVSSRAYTVSEEESVS